MKSMAREYCDSVKSQMMVYFANWEPSTPLKLGDYGIVEGNIFTKLGNIAQKRIDFKIHKENNKSHKYLTSRTGVTCTFNPQTKINVAGQDDLLKANIDIKFSSENCFFLNASGCITSMIEDKAKLGKDVMKLLKKNDWKKEYVIVTDIVESEKTTIAISSSSNSSIIFEANSPLIEQINLSDSSIDLQIKNENAIGYSIHTSDKLIPLIGLCGMRPKFFAQAEFKPIIKKFPNVVSSFLYATGKASDSATIASISLNNIESSLNNIRNDLGFKSGIQYIGNDLENGATFEIENINLEDVVDVIKIEDVTRKPKDIKIVRKMASNIEINIDNIGEVKVFDLTNILGVKSDDLNFGQLI